MRKIEMAQRLITLLEYALADADERADRAETKTLRVIGERDAARRELDAARTIASNMEAAFKRAESARLELVRNAADAAVRVAEASRREARERYVERLIGIQRAAQNNAHAVVSNAVEFALAEARRES